MGTFADCYFALTNLRIVEKNPRKFKIDQNELQERRAFIDRSKATVRVSYILLLCTHNLLYSTKFVYFIKRSFAAKIFLLFYKFMY